MTLEAANTAVTEEQKRRLGTKTIKAVSIIESAKELNEIADKQNAGWEPIEPTVDSGAADTVTPAHALKHIEVDTSNADGEGLKRLTVEK